MLDYLFDTGKSLNQRGKSILESHKRYFKISLSVRALSHLLKTFFLFAALQCFRVFMI